MKPRYSYAIIKENNPYWGRESTLLHNDYRPYKYAFISRVVNKDGSESIAFISYSDDLQALQDWAKGYVSWYNYPLGVSKDMQGYLRELA